MDSTQAAPGETSTCALLDLPAESRVNIFEHCFPPSERELSACDHICRESHAAAVPTLPVALLQTCKWIQFEASAILYENTTFNIHIYTHLGHLVDKRDYLGQTSDFLALRRVRRVKLHPFATSAEKTFKFVYSVRKVLEALDYCRAVKDLTLHFSRISDKMDTERVLEVFSELQCQGTIKMYVSPSFSQSYKGKAMARLARTLNAYVQLM